MIYDIKIEEIKNIAQLAGEAILSVYKMDFEIQYKDDKSPLTTADKVSNTIICENLQKLYPKIPILSEENKEVPFEERKDWEYYWCVDPIDGTKEFIKKNGEFTVNIALIHNSIPILGVVFAPVLNDMYYAKKDMGAYLNGKKLPLEKDSSKFLVVASKSHRTEETDDFISDLKRKHKNLTLISKGSSLKLCLVAKGEANVYPRIAPTMEWDTAAAHAIVLESGKNVFVYESKIDTLDYFNNENLKQLMYNKKNLLNSSFVVA